MPKNTDSTNEAQLEAPLALAADQLELVAGGVSLAKIGPIGPTNGLYQIVKLGALPQLSMPGIVAM